MLDYLKLVGKIDRTKEWLIVGKGPSFDRIDEFKTDYNIFGLNHVASLIKTDLTNIIDINVLTLPIVENSKVVLIPWHPHIRCRASEFTLKDRLINSMPPYGTMAFLKELELDKKLYWYHLTTWLKKPRIKVPSTIQARFFSVEAAVHILANLGITKINLLGIDGGSNYAAKFKHLQPLENGRSNFDRQFHEIEKKKKKFNLTIRNLGKEE